MKFLSDLAFALMVFYGSVFALRKAHNYFEYKVLSTIQKGLPKMQPFTEKMTGKDANWLFEPRKKEKK